MVGDRVRYGVVVFVVRFVLVVPFVLVILSLLSTTVIANP